MAIKHIVPCIGVVVLLVRHAVDAKCVGCEDFLVVADIADAADTAVNALADELPGRAVVWIIIAVRE